MRCNRIWYAMNVYQVPPQTVPSQFNIEILQLQNPIELLCNTYNYLKVYLKYTHIFEWIVCIYVWLRVGVSILLRDKNALYLLRI